MREPHGHFRLCDAASTRPQWNVLGWHGMTKNERRNALGRVGHFQPDVGPPHSNPPGGSSPLDRRSLLSPLGTGAASPAAPSGPSPRPQEDELEAAAQCPRRPYEKLAWGFSSSLRM